MIQDLTAQTELRLCKQAVLFLYLLLHLLDFPDGAASQLAVLVPEEVHVEISRLAELLLFLLLSVFQLALCTDALSVVHVICFHHLQEEYNR